MLLGKMKVDLDPLLLIFRDEGSVADEAGSFALPRYPDSDPRRKRKATEEEKATGTEEGSCANNGDPRGC